jgi:hypothetical protein
MTEKTQRIQLTISTVVEFDLDPSAYPEEARDDPQKMLQLEIEQAKEDPSHYTLDKEYIVSGKIIKG